ncbi:MAG: zinc ribbon domain-containing protein [candidate division WOR-3 bacterium]
MPVYEYRCEKCRRKFDVVASIAEKESGLNPVCPQCGSRKVRQVFGRFTVLAGSKTESDDFETEGRDDDFGSDVDDMSEDFGSDYDDEFGDDEDLDTGDDEFKDSDDEDFD